MLIAYLFSHGQQRMRIAKLPVWSSLPSKRLLRQLSWKPISKLTIPDVSLNLTAFQACFFKSESVKCLCVNINLDGFWTAAREDRTAAGYVWNSDGTTKLDGTLVDTWNAQNGAYSLCAIIHASAAKLSLSGKPCSDDNWLVLCQSPWLNGGSRHPYFMLCIYVVILNIFLNLTTNLST